MEYFDLTLFGIPAVDLVSCYHPSFYFSFLVVAAAAAAAAAAVVVVVVAVILIFRFGKSPEAFVSPELLRRNK